MPRSSALDRRVRLCFCLLAAAAAALPVGAAEPDQVLVIYNEDWAEDRVDSEPGQDSEELARYYVRRHTDPETGKKPYLLGLSSPVPERPVLNEPVLPESSDDNGLGLVYNGEDPVDPDGWLLSSRHGNVAAPRQMIEAAKAPAQFAAIAFAQREIGNDPQRLLVGLVRATGERELLLAGSPKGVRKHPAVRLLPHPKALLILLDVRALGTRPGAVLQVQCTTASGKQVRLSDACPTAGEAGSPKSFQPLPKGGLKLPAKSRIRPDLLRMTDLFAAAKRGVLYGLRIQADRAGQLDLGTLKLSVRRPGQSDSQNVIYDARTGQMSLPVALWRLTDGSVVVQCNLARAMAGKVEAQLTAEREDGQPWRQSWTLYDLADFRASRTGADGTRDDATYRNTIAKPIRRFLETHRTDDGTLLKDHILYIVAVRGLPLRVESLYGIRRGAVSSTRRGDFGDGSALTQRLRMLYYELPDSMWRPTVVPIGGKPNRPGLPVIAHPLMRCLVGPKHNPYMHPLTHQAGPRKRAWQRGGWDAVQQLDPRPFTTELRSQKPDGQFLYSATRIDAPSMATARSQIDGAIYASRYLTPQMGPVYYGPYQEAPLTAKALAKLGFETRPVPKAADRALSYSGIFSTGPRWHEDQGKDQKSAAVWHRGFYPGSIGYPIRSWLGWDHHRPPRENVTLFEQVVRGGVTITAGSSGGAHDTNLSWPDAFILHHLLFSGYDYGDAALRSTIYLDWTLSLVGDPLYSPDLDQTRPDTTPPQVARPEDIQLTPRPAGESTFAVDARIELANEDPEMVETKIICWPEGSPEEAITAENSHYSAQPRAWAMPLQPETTYQVAILLTDPYGNTFDSRDAFGPLTVVTPPAPESQRLEQTYWHWTGKATLPLGKLDLDDAGEIEIHYIPSLPGEVPTIDAGSQRLFGARGLRVGGAQASLPRKNKGLTDALPAGKLARLVLRWRRFPTTREVYIHTADGRQLLATTANTLPWTRQTRLGRILHIRSQGPVSEMHLHEAPPAAPQTHRTLLLPPRLRDASQ